MREFLLLSLLIPKKDQVSPVKVLSPNWKTSESKFLYEKKLRYNVTVKFVFFKNNKIRLLRQS